MVKLRLPKKVVIIVSGVTVLTGASGATAFFIGKDRILGPSAEELSGVECTDVIRVADMRKDRAPWLRKYVRVAPGTDGMTRVKTALRVAKKVQETLPADLIEIAVIDQAGPDKRAAMRGRAVGAEVILVRDPAKVPGIAEPYTIRYYQGAASGTGMFYGEEATMTSAEAEELLSKMKEMNDCTPPPGKEDAGEKKGEKKKETKHEKKPEKKEKPKEGEGHEAPAAEAPKKEEKPEVVFPNDVFGKMQKAAFQKAEEASAAEEEAKAKAEEHAKKPGMFGKMLGMVGLGSKEEAEGEHGASEGGGEHEAAAPGTEGHGGEHSAPAEESGAAHAPAGAEPLAGHETKAGGKPAAHSEKSTEANTLHGGKSGSTVLEAAAPAEEKSGGLMSKMLGMVGLGGEKPKDIIKHSGGPAIVSGTKVIKDEAAHGEGPAPVNHGKQPARSTGEDHPAPAEHGAATEHSPADHGGPASAGGEDKAKAEGGDHASMVDHGGAAGAEHGAAAEGAVHGEEKASAHGEAPASADHGNEPANSAGGDHADSAEHGSAAGHEKPSAQEVPATDAAGASDHAAATAGGEHSAGEPKKEDHAPVGHGG